MNTYTIFSILRRKNKAQYILYFLCTTFSFAIISAYSLLIFSPTVLEVLPVGGDSRKQAFGIFAAVCLGCMAFAFYSSSLFFKKKQKELGIMMALGGNRRKLYKVVATENLLIELLGLGLGILLAAPINKSIWGIMHLFIDNSEMQLRMNPQTLGITLAMAAVIIVISFLTLRKTIFDLDLMDVVKSEHKNEMVKKPLKQTGIIGIVLTVLGFIISYSMPYVYMDIFSAYPPEWLNVLYIIPLVGIYMILLHVVVTGFGPKKDKYKNMISRSMMIFQGKQTVNCMLVLTLLIGGGCFAGFYVPVMMSGMGVTLSERVWNYQYEMPREISDFSPQELENIITDNEGIIEEKITLPMLLLACDGMREYEEGKNFYHIYKLLYRTIRVIKQSDYQAFSRTKIELSANGYMTVVDNEGIGEYDANEDITLMTNMTTRNGENVVFEGKLPCEDLCLLNYTVYVVRDDLFEKLEQGIEDSWRSDLHYMKVKNDTSEIAEEVYDAFVSVFPYEYRIDSSYDAITKIADNEDGLEYWLDAPEYDTLRYYPENNADFEREWLYAPLFISMIVQHSIRNYSVFLMLFVYVSIVTLVASWLIAYTRCVTIVMNNRYVFDDLEKLGASMLFRQRELNRQLTVIFKFPTIIGMMIVYLFYSLILFGNDGGIFSRGELLALGICLILELFIGLITWIIYRTTSKITQKHIFSSNNR